MMAQQLIRFALFFLILVISPLKVMAEEIFKSDADYDKWTSNFYLNPELEKVVPAFHYYCGSKLSNQRNIRVLISHFYAAILRSHPALVDDLFNSVQPGANERVQSFALNTLWLVNSDHSRELLLKAKMNWELTDNNRRTIDQSIGIRPQWPLDLPITSTASIDILWTIFSATGDAQPVKKIISVLHFVEDGTGNEIIIGGGAKWSLESQMRIHKLVVEIVGEELRTATGPTKGLLEELVKKTVRKAA